MGNVEVVAEYDLVKQLERNGVANAILTRHVGKGNCVYYSAEELET
jgi:hypothetical protein